jgi:putative transferase (TIGR04331 family)
VELILGQIPKDYCPDKYIVVGPSCYIGREDIYYRFEESTISFDSFITIDELKRIESICSQYTLDLLKRKISFFNKLSDLNLSHKFWKVMLFPWMIYLVQTLYERQIRVTKILHQYGEEKIFVTLVSDNIKWEFIDTLDFLKNGLLNPIFNEWLYSRIIENSLPDNWTYTYVDKSSDYKTSRKEENRELSIRKIIKNSTLYKWKTGFLRVHGIYGFKFIDYLIFNILLHIKSSKIYPKFEKEGLRNFTTSSKECVNIDWKFDLENIFNKVIPVNYKNLKTQILKAKIKVQPNKINIVSAAQVTEFDDKRKLKLAIRYESGERLISVQHGGHNYGTGLINSIPALTEYNLDGFITWGWKKQENYCCNFIPLPSPLLSKYINKYNGVNKKIILVGNRMSSFFYYLDFMPNTNQILSYRQSKILFMDSLGDKILENFYYKPYFKDDLAFQDREYIFYKRPEIKQLDKSLHSEMLNCNMLVLDHPGSTLIFALVANIPFVCYWNMSLFPFSGDAKKYLVQMSSLGIFYDNPVDASKQVNKVYSKVRLWWLSDDIQEFRKHYLSSHGLTSKFWRKEWIKYFSNVKKY